MPKKRSKSFEEEIEDAKRLEAEMDRIAEEIQRKGDIKAEEIMRDGGIKPEFLAAVNDRQYVSNKDKAKNVKRVAREEDKAKSVDDLINEAVQVEREKVLDEMENINPPIINLLNRYRPFLKIGMVIIGFVLVMATISAIVSVSHAIEEAEASLNEELKEIEWELRTGMNSLEDSIYELPSELDGTGSESQSLLDRALNLIKTPYTFLKDTIQRIIEKLLDFSPGAV